MTCPACIASVFALFVTFRGRPRNGGVRSRETWDEIIPSPTRFRGSAVIVFIVNVSKPEAGYDSLDYHSLKNLCDKVVDQYSIFYSRPKIISKNPVSLPVVFVHTCTPKTSTYQTHGVQIVLT